MRRTSIEQTMLSALNRSIVYPMYPTTTGAFDSLLVKRKWPLPTYCPVCGRVSLITNIQENLRESCFCIRCHASNRQRQLAFTLCATAATVAHKRITSLREFARLNNLAVYNTEAQGAIHNHLEGMRSYTCSEYLGAEHHDTVRDAMHQDLMALTFESSLFDFVLSSDVFEHVPDPYKAHTEVYRVLKPGGRHIFTVPFYQTEFADETRATLDDEGSLVLLKEPVYHGDPIRSGGALVFNIFSLEMLVKLNKIGFRTSVYHLHDVKRGILGPNAIVFEAIKS
jgi:SAM-dependent methyltransferase